MGKCLILSCCFMEGCSRNLVESNITDFLIRDVCLSELPLPLHASNCCCVAFLSSSSSHGIVAYFVVFA
jgi:hypothetical protein